MNEIFMWVILLLCPISARMDEVKKSEPILWKNLYHGDFSLSHKMILSRQTKSTNDQLLSQFMLVYLYYSMGDIEKSIGMLESIDRYIEYHYMKTSSW